jgi:diguanylate cyclase (GGDEF)-like protein
MWESEETDMFNSIRARLLLLLSSIFLLLGLGATYNAYERRQADSRAVHEKLRAQTRFIAEQQSDSVRRAERFLEFMVSAMSVSAMASDPDCASKMQTYVSNDPYLANAFIAAPDGRVMCNPKGGAAVSYLGDRAYFRRALATSALVAGDPVLGRFTGRWVLPYAKRQVDASGKTTAVVVASLDLNWVNQSFSEIAAKSPGLRLGLATSRGLVLARQPDAEKWVGTNISHLPAFAGLRALNGDGIVETRSHDGEMRIYAFAPFATTVNDVIYLWMTVPRAEATAAADRQFALQGLLILAATGLAIVLAWVGGHRLLVRPVERISQAAQRLARGETGVRTGLAHSDDEIGRLAMAFDDMAGQLDRVDAVTGLLNLPAFEAALDAMFAELQDQQARRIVVRVQVMALDQLEASLGLAAGVEAIKCFAQLLQREIGMRGLVCRIGEGNFAFTMHESCDAAATSELIEQLERCLAAHPLRLGDHVVEWKTAFGGACFPVDSRHAAELLRYAGVALAQVQSSTPAHLRFYEQAMNERLLRRMRRLSELKRAVREGGFEQHYQPQVDMHTGRLMGFEALLRWNHPEEGTISPGEFIGLAEETGLILPLGDWVMRQAMRQLVAWREAHPAFESLVMAINVSAVQLSAGDFSVKLRDALAATGAPANRIELEVTESHLMHLSDQVKDLMQQLKDIGVHLSIDDFGTGYSSLAYLKHLAVDRLKIDKCFVDNLSDGSDDAAIVEATIAMGHKLGLSVIAEGIESKQQLDILQAMGCDQAQGYYVSRPMPAGDAEAFALRAISGLHGIVMSTKHRMIET